MRVVKVVCYSVDDPNVPYACQGAAGRKEHIARNNRIHNGQGPIPEW